MDALENDAILCSYVLCEYTIKGGEGLLPLHVGNKWRYRQSSCTDWAGQRIELEIVSGTGDSYYISGLDYAFFKPEVYDKTDAATMKNIIQHAPWIKDA